MSNILSRKEHYLEQQIQLVEEQIQEQELLKKLAQLKGKRAEVLAAQYQAQKSGIDAQIAGTKVGIAYEVLAQNHHQLAAARNQTGVEAEKLNESSDLLAAATSGRRLKKQSLRQGLQALNLQIEQAIAANESAAVSLATAKGDSVTVKSLPSV